MKRIDMTWLGGPKDGEVISVSERMVGKPIKIIHGVKSHPEEHHVTPLHLADGRWILPWSPAIAALEETR